MPNNAADHKRLAGYLRCLIYDLFVLATAVAELKRSRSLALIEVYKTAGLLKLRTVHDFFYRPQAQNSIKRAMFDCYVPTHPQQQQFDWPEWLCLQSIHTYVVHLDVSRVTKKYEEDDKRSGKKKGDELPQPKFEKGARDVISASITLMQQAKRFVDSVMAHRDFYGLNKHGKRYWAGFQRELHALLSPS